MSYQEPKSKDYGVNNCEGCLEKQRIIDRQFEEIVRLKQKLHLNRRNESQGFFGSSTPSSQVPVKENSLAEKRAKSVFSGGDIPGFAQNDLPNLSRWVQKCAFWGWEAWRVR